MKTLLALSFSLLVGLAVAASARADTAAFDKQMQVVLADYLKVHAALAADKLDGVARAAKKISKAAAGLNPALVTGEHSGHFKKIPQNLTAAAANLAKAKTIEAARAAFKELSKPMAMWASMSKPSGVNVVFCSMAKGSWLQKAGAIRNPYYGAKMLNCGAVVAGG